jgi:GT2 family glycosyltransferase
VTAGAQPAISVVVLTLGTRPGELRAAVVGALAQRGVDAEVVVVANGVPPALLALPDDPRLRIVAAAANNGVPGGRNLGAQHAQGALLAFLDDDARFTDDDVLARATDAFDADERLGAVALRIVDEDGTTARRHVPRIGSRGPDRSGAVTSFLGGACVIRRTAFDDAGRYASAFFYAMEETDLALRLLDRRWTIRYDGAPAVVHPPTDPARHPAAAERTMRNRVWVAYRNLPAPLAVAYVLDWLAISIARGPRRASALVRGTLDGWHSRPRGQRNPISWRTVARLTRLGRPPIL